MLKPVWKAMRVLLQGLLHSILVPVITLLKALDAGIKHLISELNKI